MIAVEHMDYGALKLVKGEIDVNLLKAHDALDAFIKNTEDAAQIKLCSILLHQVHGALQMLDFTWASVLAGVMEKVACAIAEDSNKRTDWAYDTLTQSINDFPKHLARLQDGEDTPPLEFIPLLNDLRVASGGSVLSEAMVFSLKSTLAANAPGRMPKGNGNRDSQEPPSLDLEIKSYDALEIRALAGRLRPVYQTGLLVWYRDSHNKAALRRLMEVMIQLQQASPGEGLWYAAGDVIEKLLEGNLECSTSIKLLLGQVERQIRRVMEAGPADLLLKPPTDLIKNLLHYIAVVENQADIFSGTSSSQQDPSHGKNVESSKSTLLLDMAAKAVKDELGWAKKKLDDFAHSGGRHTQDELRAIMDVLRRVSDTLDMLGRWELRQRVRRQTGILGSMLGEESFLSDPRIMEVANALLYVESLLGDKKIQPKSAFKTLPNDLTRHLQPMREEEYHELCRAIIREVMVELTQVKDNIIAFSKESGQCDLLSPVPHLMHRIIGALTMLSLRRPTIVLKAVYHYISHELLGARIVPTQEVLESLADVLTSVEFFLETMVESQMNLDSLLDMAEGNIINLGYLIERVDEMVVDVGASNMLADQHEITTKDEIIVLSSPQGSEPLAEDPVEKIVFSEVTVIAEPVALAPQVESIAVIAHSTVASVNHENDAAVMAGQNEGVVDEIIELFVEEATEAIDIIHQYYPKWKKDIDDVASLNTFRRSFHTLKGSGRLVGANVVGELSWAVEILLNAIIEGEINASLAIFEYLEECLPVVSMLVEKFQVSRTKAEISDDVQALIDKSKTLMVMQETISEPEYPTLFVVDAAESLELMAMQEESFIETEINGNISADESIEIVDVAELEESIVSIVKEEASGIDPILLEIFTNESVMRLKEIREFIDHFQKSRKRNVTESLMRNLHTIQGSASMAGFLEISELAEVFERHINFINNEKKEMTDEELSSLKDFVDIMDILLHLKHPLQETENAVRSMEKHHGLMLRMHKIIDKSHQVKTFTEIVVEESIPEADSSIHSGVDDDHEEMVVQIFLEEAAEILENTEAALHQWMSTPGVIAPIARLERELHTLKGGARMAGMASMGDLSHSVESLLSAVVAGNMEVTDEIVQLLQQSHDQLHHMLEQEIKHLSIVPAVELIARLEALAGHSVLGDTRPLKGTVTTTNETVITAYSEGVVDPVELEAQPVVSESISTLMSESTSEEEWLIEKTSTEQVRIKANILDNLANKAGELSISRARLEQQVTMLRFGLNEMKQTVGRLREKIRKLDMETEAQILFRYQEVSNQGEEFDPLEFDRFSLVQQLSRGMMEGTSDLSSIQSQFEKQVGDAEALLLQHAHMNTELQETVMSTRLLPFSGVSSRMKRLVRQISRETGKLIDFDVSGESIEMDRTVLDKIIGPLEHMIRNAVDHGIEDVVKRRKIGKPDKGKISLHLAKEGVEMVLKMHDDGAGLDFKAIRRKAIERDLVAEHEVIDDQTLMQFVLASGFSTAEKITQLSGRGVGMDVVNNEIKQLNGSLNIESKFGQGSTFTIRLPVALSVARALIVKDHGQVYAILHSSIDGVMRVDHAALMKAYNEPSPVLEYASGHYPIHSLHSFLAGDISSLPDEQTRHLFLMVHGSGQRVALRIDSFVDSREIVVKSLGLQLSSVRGIMGATIMGNGNVVLILDIPVLLRVSIVEDQPRLKNNSLSGQSAGLQHVAHEKVLTVMVVDDSITVRKVTSRLLERNHMHVITAKDGVDAVEVLQNHIPDVMLLDIEMPRMDGFELASVIRNDERLKHIPIIMITSRAGDKHREHAMRLGVNQYLGKPYQEDELMEHVRSLGLLGVAKSDPVSVELSTAG